MSVYFLFLEIMYSKCWSKAINSCNQCWSDGMKYSYLIQMEKTFFFCPVCRFLKKYAEHSMILWRKGVLEGNFQFIEDFFLLRVQLLWPWINTLTERDHKRDDTTDWNLFSKDHFHLVWISWNDGSELKIQGIYQLQDFQEFWEI